MNTILIVDDDMIGRFTVESILEGEGYQLVMAENGKDALQKARQSPPKPARHHPFGRNDARNERI